jgi:hypothetical protein
MNTAPDARFDIQMSDVLPNDTVDISDDEFDNR